MALYRKRRKIKVVSVVLTLLLLVGLGAILGGSVYLFTKDKSEDLPLPTATPLPTPEVVDTSFSMIMVGDALIHDPVYYDAKTEDGYDFRPMLTDLKLLVEPYDVAYYNQETILGGEELGLSTYPRFNSPYEVGDAFVDCGFNLVSLSTNHTLDRGEQAILNSRDYWDMQDGVLAAGSYRSFDERNTPVIKEVNGITYTMLSYTDTTNGLMVPEGKEYLLNVFDEETVKNDIARVRDQVDVLMVSMHFGTEYSLGISARQREIASFLADQGVDIVIGTHPHVVEPIEWIDDTLVIYSLGNVISAQRGVERLTGGVVSVTFHVVEEDEVRSMYMEDVKAGLIYTDSIGEGTSSRHAFHLYPYSSLNETILPNYQTYYEKYMGVLRQMDATIGELTPIS